MSLPNPRIPTLLLLAALLGTSLTRPAGAQLLELELVTDAVNQPMFLAGAADGRLFVAERGGRIWIVENGVRRGEPFLDINTQVDTSFEGGLLSFALHPDFATNGRIFVSYTTPCEDGSGSAACGVIADEPDFCSVVSRFEVSADDPDKADPAESRLLVLEQPFMNHNGGQLQFGPDGYLYAAFGDGGSGNDPICAGQRLDLWLGKILRLDVDAGADSPPYYSVPGSNPFSGAQDGACDEIWNYGLRNPWRFSFDRETGDLWIGDVGQNQREEINREDAADPGGRNYGWKVMEANECANPAAAACPVAPPPCDDPSYTPPIYDYGRGQGDRSITGGYVYRGDDWPALFGLYLYADFESGRIWSLSGADGGPVVRDELRDQGGAWTSFGEDARGELYVMDLFTDEIFRVGLGEPGAGSGQSKCITGLNQKLATTTRAHDRNAASCLKQGARGKLAGTLTACLDTDSKAVVRAEAKTTRFDDKKCEGVRGIGPTGASPILAAARSGAREVFELPFGDGVDGAVIARSVDKAGARCQAAVVRGVQRCHLAHLSEFQRCKRELFKQGPVEAAALDACLGADPKQKIARACDPVAGRVATRDLTRKCQDVGLDTALPGCAPAADVPGVAVCLDALGRCASCRALRDADRLGVDCDVFDDAAVNQSCVEGS